MGERIPLMMGEKLIGAIEIDEKTGEFTGDFKKEVLDIVLDGLKDGILQIAFYGRAAVPIEKAHAAQEKLADYIDGDKKKSLWDTRTER